MPQHHPIHRQIRPNDPNPSPMVLSKIRRHPPKKPQKFGRGQRIIEEYFGEFLDRGAEGRGIVQKFDVAVDRGWGKSDIYLTVEVQ